MKVIKRDGREVDFDRNKIISAIGKANSESHANREKTLSDDEIKNIATRIYDKLRRSKRVYSVEDIQDLIEEYIDKYGWVFFGKR
jgi:ribonucleoside-triphosphate reductase